MIVDALYSDMANDVVGDGASLFASAFFGDSPVPDRFHL